MLSPNAHLRLVPFAVIVALVAAPHVAAIDIQLVFESGSSQNPASDPAGAELTRILQHVESYYEDIFEDAHTLIVHYWWEDMNQAVGLTGPFSLDANNRVIETFMRFDSQINAPWFFDDDPAEHSEYVLQQTLYGNLSPVNQSDWFFGAPPDQFEVGYSGNAASGVDPAASGGQDLLSVALHEMGHALGLVGGLQTSPSTYDTAPQFLAGNSIGIREPPTDPGHLLNPFAAMAPGQQTLGAGRRFLPSAADLLAMAASQSFTNLDLPRQDFLTGNTWHTPGNWQGNSVPDSQDDAFVRHGGSVAVTSAAGIRNLLVGDSTQLFVLSTVSAAQRIRVTSGAVLTVAAGGGGFTNNLQIDMGGQFLLSGGTFNNSFLNLAGGTVVIDGGEMNNNFPIIADGTMTIQNGGVANSSVARIGDGIDFNDGHVTVDGMNSTWTIDNELNVGYLAEGMLTVRNRGRVENATAYIGRQSTGRGTVTVDGHLSLFANTGPLYVGDEGVGSLRLVGGGDATNTQGFIANQPNVSGQVTVEGAGSTWTNSEFLVVGFRGDGTLNVLDGGQVLNPNGSASIGNQDTSTGTVLVDGAGSSWTNNLTLHVGFHGTGNLTIRDGGTVSNSGTETTIAVHENSVGSVLVTDPNSHWSNDGLFSVGAAGDGHLTIRDGGLVTNSGPQTILGGAAGSSGVVDVEGMGARFDVAASALTVGVLGTGELTLRDGGAVTSAEAVLGAAPLSEGTALVEGDGSIWTNGNLTLGDQGRGNLQVLDGGIANSDFTIISNAGGVGRATVSGTGATWNNQNDLVVGMNLNTGFLTIADGGTVISRLAVVGFTPTGRGVVEVTGTDSTWINTSSLTVGQQGQGELSISAGGAVSNMFAFIGFLGGQGTVTIDGPGSSWTSTDNVLIGPTGELHIQNDGYVRSHQTMNIDGAVNLSGGELEANVIALNSGVFHFTGGTLAVDTFQGDLVQDGGTLAPGDSPGTTHITQDYILNAGNIEFQIEGLVQGTEYDFLHIDGDLTLAGGGIDVRVDSATMLSPGSQFDIIDVGGSRSGTFPGLNEGTVVGTFGGVNLAITYVAGDGNDISLLAEAVILPGDYNSDGVVNAADYVLWRNHEGESFTLPNETSTAATPGLVDQEDYDHWRQNFGSTAGAGSAGFRTSTTHLTTVPEPATSCLLALAILAYALSHTNRPALDLR